MNPARPWSPAGVQLAVLVTGLILGLGVPTASGRAEDDSFEATHIERSGEVMFDALPSGVFAHLEPLGMEKMAKSWKIDILYPASREAMQGSVLRKSHLRAPVQQIWTIVNYDPPERIKYVIYVPDMEVWEFETILKAAPDGRTSAEVHHRITSLSRRANPAVEEFGETFDAYLEGWRNVIQDALGSG